MKILLVAVNAKYIHSKRNTPLINSFLIYSAIFTEGSRTWLLFPVISGTV